MLSKEIEKVFLASRKAGWVLEPEAKEIFSKAGLPVPKFAWAKDKSQLESIASDIGFPLAAKVVSPSVLHKSDVQGVAVGLQSVEELTAFFNRVSELPDFQGIHVEEMGMGTELIVGAKVDYQFGPIVLVGIGGTGVEVYQDVAIRMAPLSQKDINSMLDELKGGKILTGYRGKEPINIKALSEVLHRFSELLLEMETFIESIDLNPLLCSPEGCMVADARIMLAEEFIK